MTSSLAIARERDHADELAEFRTEFAIPRTSTGADAHYLSGHSLGLMPKRARSLIARELDRWAARGVGGHFDEDGWLDYHERFAATLAALAGAEPDEVVVMNSLTTNLHLMLASFYRPQRRGGSRILIEQHAFPSDRFAVQSQLALHGLDPATHLVELTGERLTAEALEAELEAQGGRVALVLLPGVQYLNGEAIDLSACAAVARQHGCRVGFDLAHAIGNLRLDLDGADPDFAIWCSYKYLNGGPGAIGGCFVNRRWHNDSQKLPRLEGWWGHAKSRRFGQSNRFEPIATAEAWQLSNPPILAMLPLEASLALFAAADIERLRRKSVALTGYLEDRLRQDCGDRIEILTPTESDARGAQLSLRLRSDRPARDVVLDLERRGVIGDWREPDVLRLAPVPLYNTFVDVHEAAAALAAALDG